MLHGDADGVPWADFCFQEWRETHGFDPPWSKLEYVKLNLALKRLNSEDVARAAWKAFLDSDDQYSEGHAPGLFLATLAKWTVRAAKKKPQKQVGSGVAAIYAARAELLREIERDPRFPSVREQRDEYSRRVKEFPLDS